MLRTTRISKGLFLLTLSAALALGACGRSARATTMYLVKTSGDVDVFDQSGDAVELIENIGLYSGYRVSTMDESYAWIDLDDVKLVKMDAASEADIRKDGNDLELVVNTGSLYFNITEPLAGDESLSIRSSTMTVGIRGTCGWVTAPDEERFLVYLLEGSVECTASDTNTYGMDSWVIQAGMKAEFTCTDGEIKARVESLDVSEIPAFVREEGLPREYEELLAELPPQEEGEAALEEETEDGSVEADEMPEPTPGGGIETMYGSYVNEEGREAWIVISSRDAEGEDELRISLDEQSAKAATLEKAEENVYRGIGPQGAQVYWVVFDPAGMQITALDAADEDYKRIAGYYRQTEIYIEETGESVPVSGFSL